MHTDFQHSSVSEDDKRLRPIGCRHSFLIEKVEQLGSRLLALVRAPYVTSKRLPPSSGGSKDHKWLLHCQQLFANEDAKRLLSDSYMYLSWSDDYERLVP